MNLEDMLKTPQEALKAGISMSDDAFEQHAEQIIASLSTDKLCCYWAGRDWKDERFERAQQQIIKAVASSPSLCMDAGYAWKDERFSKAEPKIMKQILRDANKCYCAGSNWKDERFDKYAEQIIAGIERNPVQCLNAGMQWEDHRFNRYASRLLYAILKGSAATIATARTYLRPQRKVMLDYPEYAEHIASIDSQYFDSYMKFSEKIGIDTLQKLHAEDMYSVTEAFEFAKQTRNQARFYQGLKESIEKGSVNKWSKTIIKYFRDNAKGAGNYRMIEVTA